jgi:uncharacterized protein
MLKLGQLNTLTVTRRDASGLYFDNDGQSEAWMPQSVVPTGRDVGDVLDVFVYQDLEDGLIAIVQPPLIMANQFAVLWVVGLSRTGDAFLDWGMPHEILLPRALQQGNVRQGDRVVVLGEVEPERQLMRANMCFRDYIAPEPVVFDRGQPVSLLVSAITPLGYAVIVNRAHVAVLHRPDATRTLSVGEEVAGFIAEQKPDGRITATMLSASRDKVSEVAADVLASIRQSNGQLDFDDASDPDVIRSYFACSKRVFKQALGQLLKEGKIEFTRPGVKLVE